MSDFGHQLAMQLRRAYLTMHRNANSCFMEFGLSADSFTILFVLDEHGAMAQKELVERIYSDANTVSAMLNRLESVSLVTRKRSIHDGRVRLVEITEKGRTIKNQMWQKSQPIRDQFNQLFDAEEQTAVSDFLTRIAKEMNVEEGPLDK